MAHAPRKSLLLLVTCQQSILATPEAIDAAVVHTYAPLLDALAAFPSQRVALHVHGYLLDRLARAHEGFLLRLKDFVATGQVELLGGLFYGAPPSLLSETDVRGQVAMLQEFWASFVGEAPHGMALPELALAHELPRLVADTGMRYAIAGDGQLQPAPFLSRLLRGGAELPVFALDVALGLAYASGEEAAWGRDVAAALAPERPVAVHLRLEAVGGDVSARLRELFGALAQGGAETRLPKHFLADVAMAELPIATLVRAFAPLSAPADPEARGFADWSCYAAHYPEASQLLTRTLHASGRLAHAIARMEDEHLDEGWSDALATAQRHLFAAQSAEAMGLGPDSGGVRDARVRQATENLLEAAEGVLDQLEGGALPHGSRAAGPLAPPT